MMQAIWKEVPLDYACLYNMQLVIASFNGAMMHATVGIWHKTLSFHGVTL